MHVRKCWCESLLINIWCNELGSGGGEDLIIDKTIWKEECVYFSIEPLGHPFFQKEQFYKGELKAMEISHTRGKVGIFNNMIVKEHWITHLLRLKKVCISRKYITMNEITFDKILTKYSFLHIYSINICTIVISLIIFPDPVNWLLWWELVNIARIISDGARGCVCKRNHTCLKGGGLKKITPSHFAKSLPRFP